MEIQSELKRLQSITPSSDATEGKTGKWKCDNISPLMINCFQEDTSLLSVQNRTENKITEVTKWELQFSCILQKQIFISSEFSLIMMYNYCFDTEKSSVIIGWEVTVVLRSMRMGEAAVEPFVRLWSLLSGGGIFYLFPLDGKFLWRFQFNLVQREQ